MRPGAWGRSPSTYDPHIVLILIITAWSQVWRCFYTTFVQTLQSNKNKIMMCVYFIIYLPPPVQIVLQIDWADRY